MKLAKRLMMRQQASGGWGAWDPSQISGAKIFDPDNATFRVLSGSYVTSLTDTIGGVSQISHVSNTYRPTLVADDLNGNDVLLFDGNDSLYTSTFPPVGTGDSLVFAVWLTTKSTDNVIIMRGAKVSQAGTGIFYSGTGKYSAFNWGIASAEVVGTKDRWVMQLGQRNASGIRVGLDGVLSGYISAGTLNITSGDLSIGCTTAGGLDVTGRLAVAVIAQAVSGADIDRLYGWAAHKYGLTANLPSGHPYKTNAP